MDCIIFTHPRISITKHISHPSVQHMPYHLEVDCNRNTYIGTSNINGVSKHLSKQSNIRISKTYHITQEQGKIEIHILETCQLNGALKHIRTITHQNVQDMSHYTIVRKN